MDSGPERGGVMSKTSNSMPGLSVVVERLCADGRRFAIRVPVRQVGEDIVMDHQSALGAHELLRAEAAA